jgi:hypothetical protein
MTDLIYSIETTGTVSSSEITVIGFADPQTEDIHIHYQHPGDKSSGNQNGVTEAVQDHFSSAPVEYDITGYAYINECDLLLHAQKWATDENYVSKPTTLIGFNSDKFDLPMIRTRCLLNDIPWELGGISSEDIMKTYQYKFNTSDYDISGLNKKPLRKFGEHIGAPVDSDMYKSELIEIIKEYPYSDSELNAFLSENNHDQPTTTKQSLNEIFELLGDGVSYPDPFDNSSEAVTAFNNGNIEDVIAHNICDLMKTVYLFETVTEYVSSEERRTRPL